MTPFRWPITKSLSSRSVQHTKPLKGRWPTCSNDRKMARPLPLPTPKAHLMKRPKTSNLRIQVTTSKSVVRGPRRTSTVCSLNKVICTLFWSWKTRPMKLVNKISRRHTKSLRSNTIQTSWATPLRIKIRKCGLRLSKLMRLCWTRPSVKSTIQPCHSMMIFLLLRTLLMRPFSKCLPQFSTEMRVLQRENLNSVLGTLIHHWMKSKSFIVIGVISKRGVNSLNMMSMTWMRRKIAGNVGTWKQKIKNSVPSTKNWNGKDWLNYQKWLIKMTPELRQWPLLRKQRSKRKKMPKRNLKRKKFAISKCFKRRSRTKKLWRWNFKKTQIFWARKMPNKWILPTKRKSKNWLNSVRWNSRVPSTTNFGSSRYRSVSLLLRKLARSSKP